MQDGKALEPAQVIVDIMLWEDRILFSTSNSAGLSRKWMELLRSLGLEYREEYCSPCG